MKTDYCDQRFFLAVLGVLTVENRLALITSMTTGLRIDDVLHLRTDTIKKGRFTIREKKTNKLRKVRLPDNLIDDLLKISGKIYVFEGRTDYRKPRTRQAVYKDLRRACRCFRVSETIVLRPHTARKIYAVEAYKRTCDIKKVKELLNHSNEAVTALYALSDAVTEKSHTVSQMDSIRYGVEL